MARRDSIHYPVRRALEKDGWDIFRDPYTISSGGVDVEIDMAAEKLFFAQKGNIRILVEVKTLLKRSFIYDFHGAVGQYMDYRSILKDEHIDHQIYLAISEESYLSMKKKPFYGKRK